MPSRVLRCEFTPSDYDRISSDGDAIRKGSSNLRDLVMNKAGGGKLRAHKALVETCKKSRWSFDSHDMFFRLSSDNASRLVLIALTSKR